MEAGPASIDAWLAQRAQHVPSARLQLLDNAGKLVFDRVIGGADSRFEGISVTADDAAVTAARSWSRGVSLGLVGDRVVLRAISPVVNAQLAMTGVLVLSTPLDGDFADSIKGALSADVLIGGPSGHLAVTFRTPLGKRAATLDLPLGERTAALRGTRISDSIEVEGSRYQISATALLDRKDHPIGLLGVAIDREPLAATKRLAIRSLVAGGALAVVFAMVLAAVWSRRLGAPIARLHRGAIAVSRGDLDHRIDIPGNDELTDLATAFNQMTSTLKDNQARLAARMREIVALHDAGRAVSSVIEVDPVSRKIVDAVARTFDVQLAALWLVDTSDHTLRASAARARRTDVSSSLATDEALVAADKLRAIADTVFRSRRPLRLDKAGADPEHGPTAIAAGMPGPLVALPLDRKARVVGVLAVARAETAREFSDADLNLLTTFADQAGAAVDNALLYQEVRGASEELEKKVRLRTAELTAINSELGRALADLRETQAQLVLSERMAGLGVLVAGVAHEINSPSAAIRGSIEGLPAALERVTRHGLELAARGDQPEAIRALLETLPPRLADRPLQTGIAARKLAREINSVLEAVASAWMQAPLMAAELADLGVTRDEAEQIVAALGESRDLGPAVVAALTDHVYLHRTATTISRAVTQIQRIVGALKTYSHLDQQATRTEADVHEGLETTLALLHHTLRDIVVERRYGTLPRVPVFVDELNQVWTNLISNAQQALAARTDSAAAPASIVIETSVDLTHGNTPARRGGSIIVRVIDNGPGVPGEALPRIFEPFFTTKPKGQGTGLGLGIARQIVVKHSGELRCESEPGRTVFEVRLPINPIAVTS